MGSHCASSSAAQSAGGWQFGAVLDVTHTTRALALEGRGWHMGASTPQHTAGPAGSGAAPEKPAVEMKAQPN